MRIRTGMVADVAKAIDRTGFDTVDVTGSSMFECMFRYSHEDPWDGLDIWRQWMPNSKLRAGSRSNCIAKFGLTPPRLMDLWIKTLTKHGINSFWIYDCLYNMSTMKRLCKTAHEAGAEVVPSVMYGISPVHTDEWFADKVREMASWGTADTIYVEDAPGILTVERARTLVPSVVEAAGSLPVEMQCHNTTGLAPLNYIVALENGVRILHTASRPLANGPSLPSTEIMVENVERLGYAHDLDVAMLPIVAKHFEKIAHQEGYPVGVPNEYSVFAYQHQLPGGMTGTLKAQLAQYDMEHRLNEVLEEVVNVRSDLGHPISATPFSQLMGIQAVLNVVTGERYSVVPDEVILYTLGNLGTPPAPINPEVKDRVLGTARGAELVGWEAPDPSIRELKTQYGNASMSDEELLSRYIAPAEDIEATRSAGPILQGYEFREQTSIADLVSSFFELKRPRYLHLAHPQASITIQR
jgi:oxaloacetate decarboxylase alpha subunit